MANSRDVQAPYGPYRPARLGAFGLAARVIRARDAACGRAVHTPVHTWPTYSNPRWEAERRAILRELGVDDRPKEPLSERRPSA